MLGSARAQIRIAAGRIRGIDPDEVECRTTANSRLASGGDPTRELGWLLAGELVRRMFAPRCERQKRMPRVPSHVFSIRIRFRPGHCRGGPQQAFPPERDRSPCSGFKCSGNSIPPISVPRSRCPRLEASAAVPSVTRTHYDPLRRRFRMTTARRSRWIEPSGSRAHRGDPSAVRGPIRLFFCHESA